MPVGLGVDGMEMLSFGLTAFRRQKHDGGLESEGHGSHNISCPIIQSLPSTETSPKWWYNRWQKFQPWESFGRLKSRLRSKPLSVFWNLFPQRCNSRRRNACKSGEAGSPRSESNHSNCRLIRCGRALKTTSTPHRIRVTSDYY
jgi:hypothetical protein